MQWIEMARQWIVAVLVLGIFAVLGVIAYQVVTTPELPVPTPQLPFPDGDQPDQPFVVVPTNTTGDPSAPGGATGLPTVSAPAEAATPVGMRHTVVVGDTLYGIALKFGVTLDALIAANADRLPDPNRLDVGQELIIPSPSP